VAQTPAGPVGGAGATTKPSDYSQRVVAYIYGDKPVTREELGEYLIARFGYEKVELMVNRRIVEEAAKKRNITVTDAEVEAAVDDDIKQFNMDRATFYKNILKQRRQTLYEFKEDVVRPTLMLKKMCQSEVKVEEEELKRAFETKFGEKVSCRLVLFDDLRTAQHVWAKIRESEAEFDAAARSQGNAQLASVGGRSAPIARGVAKDDIIEKIAFRLKPGEVSEIFPLPSMGKVCGVLRCEGRIPPTEGVTLEKVRAELTKAVFDQKVMEAIKPMFAKLLKEADPKMFVQHVNHDPFIQRTKDEAEKLLKEEDKPAVPLPNQPPRPSR
jgi:parvulin-like peptidyl-prolyl isomerase